MLEHQWVIGTWVKSKKYWTGLRLASGSVDCCTSLSRRQIELGGKQTS